MPPRAATGASPRVFRLCRPLYSAPSYPTKPTRGRLLRYARHGCPSPRLLRTLPQPLQRGAGARLEQQRGCKARSIRGLSPSRRSLRRVANEGGELRKPYIYVARERAEEAEGEAEQLETAGLRAGLSDGRHRSYSPAGSNAGSSGSSCTHGRTCYPYSRDAPASGRRHNSSSLPPPRGGQARGARRGNASW